MYYWLVYHAYIEFSVISMSCMDQLVSTCWFCFRIPNHPFFCSIQYVLSNIDNCIQYGEDADVKVRDFIPEEED